MSDATTPPGSATASPSDPSRYWDEWNREWRFRESLDPFMQRQREITLRVARAEGLAGARILGVGCGTAWLEQNLCPFGEVWGTDLSAEAIAEGRRRYPRVRLMHGDFLQLDLPGPFDFIVSSDSLAPMPSHEACIERIAALLRPGGILLLMTQNPFVWTRKSTLSAVSESVPHHSPQQWPSLRRVRELLRPCFAIVDATTICPGGDRGVLWWVENGRVERAGARLFGQYRWQRILEVARLGRELVVVARRRDR